MERYSNNSPFHEMRDRKTGTKTETEVLGQKPDIETDIWINTVLLSYEELCGIQKCIVME